MEKLFCTLLGLLICALPAFASDLADLKCISDASGVSIEGFMTGTTVALQKVRSRLGSEDAIDDARLTEQCEMLAKQAPVFITDQWDELHCDDGAFVSNRRVEFSFSNVRIWFTPEIPLSSAFQQISQPPGNSTSDLCNPL